MRARSAALLEELGWLPLLLAVALLLCEAVCVALAVVWPEVEDSVALAFWVVEDGNWLA